MIQYHISRRGMDYFEKENDKIVLSGLIALLLKYL
jgi:hypothetical protein